MTSSGPRPTCTRGRRRSTAARSRSSATSSPTASSPCRRSDMDLELSDEQRWLFEAIDTLLAREADPWPRLVEFGALAVGDGLGAVELCLVARALGAHLAAVPYLASAAVRFAGVPLGEEPVALAVLEPGASWDAAPATVISAGRVHGRKVAVEHAGAVERLAVLAQGPVLGLVDVGDVALH